MTDIQIVSSGTVEFSFDIRKGPLDDSGEFWYDWIAGNGDESDETFDSEAEAIADVTRRYS